MRQPAVPESVRNRINIVHRAAAVKRTSNGTKTGWIIMVVSQLRRRRIVPSICCLFHASNKLYSTKYSPSALAQWLFD